MSDVTIKVKVKSVYGKDLIYPVNDAAKTLASIAGTKTLGIGVLKMAAELGLDIKEVKVFGELSKL